MVRTAQLLLGLAPLAVERASGLDSGGIPVDFYVFRGQDGNRSDVSPRASVNVGGTDAVSGFWTLCREECPTWTERDSGGTFPQMRFCECVARLLVEDLAADFGALREDARLFTLGEYKEISVPQNLYSMDNGHDVLAGLTMAAPRSSVYRRSGRLSVWVANKIRQRGAELIGTTYLDQPLYRDAPGGGVLLEGRVSRQGHRLSHEVGHVVGFHHVAGAQVHYRYDHSHESSQCTPASWRMVSRPSCEQNIMGSWYDGPYCCPFDDAPEKKTSFLAKADQHCLVNSKAMPSQAYCCGEFCTHSCSKQQPAFTFATEEHKTMLRDILTCWLSLRGLPNPDGLSNSSSLGLMLRQNHNRVQCVDFAEELGPCESA